MSALATARRTGSAGSQRARTMHSGLRPAGAGEVVRRETPPTLGELVERTWEDLAAGGRAECLVCGAEMRSAAAGGECGRCGSALS